MSDIYKPISEAGLTESSLSILVNAGIRTVSDMLEYTRSDLMKLPGIQPEQVNEIFGKIVDNKIDQKHISAEETNYEDVNAFILSYVKKNNVRTDDLPLLSARTYNRLCTAGYERMEQFVLLDKEQLMNIPRIDKDCADEIILVCKDYVRENRLDEQFIELQRSHEEEKAEQVQEETDTASDTADEWLAGIPNEVLLAFAKVHDNEIRSLGLSVRAGNALGRNGFTRMSQIINMTEEDLLSLHNMGVTSAKEVLNKLTGFIQQNIDFIQCLTEEFQQNGTISVSDTQIEKWKNQIRKESGIVMRENDDSWMKRIPDKVLLAFAQTNDRDIDSLGLSVRAFNALGRNGFTRMSQIITRNEEDLLCLRNMGKTSAREVLDKITGFIQENKDSLLSLNDTLIQNGTIPAADIPETGLYGVDREMILAYAKENDIPLDRIGFSGRAYNCLNNSGYKNLSDFITIDEDELRRFPGIGSKSVREILDYIKGYLETHKDRIQAYAKGDLNALYTDERIQSEVLKLYEDKPFYGYSFTDFITALKLPNFITEDRLKQNIGTLLAAKKLEYVDYRCYRVYPKFEDYLKECSFIGERNKRFIEMRLAGKTLQEIGDLEGLSRERVRQVVFKGVEALKDDNFVRNAVNYFDEDYYQYLFSNYKIEKAALNFLGIPIQTYKYLDMSESISGKRKLDGALSDPKIESGLKMKIRNYLNRDKVLLDGMWIPKNKKNLSEYAIRKYCLNDTTTDEFFDIYKRFLTEIGLNDNQKLHYSGNTNFISNSEIVLNKFHFTFRYYDIGANDYTELYEELNLDSYENIAISTAKLMKEHPDIMKKYDIRDHYELYSLLKKTVPDASWHDMHMKRMPIIEFGEFDRDAAIQDILIRNSPIKMNDLIDIINDEYGYDRSSIIMNYLSPYNSFYHNGQYIMDQKVMSDENRGKLLAALTEDFYYTEEVRKIYLEQCIGAEADEVNPYNLKEMGFSVYSGYVLRNNPSVESYFRHLLTDNDLTDITPYRKKFSGIVAFSNLLNDLKREREVIEYLPNRLIHIRKLENAGITEDVLTDYCDAVYDFVQDGMYFTIQSLRESGFDHKLYEQGFDDWFYANVLAFDGRFSFGRLYANIVLCRGDHEVSKKAFVTSKVSENEIIDMFDLMDIMTDEYGLSVKDKRDILDRVKDTGIYYDPYLDRLYASEELFEREFDAAEGV